MLLRDDRMIEMRKLNEVLGVCALELLEAKADPSVQFQLGGC